MCFTLGAYGDRAWKSSELATNALRLITEEKFGKFKIPNGVDFHFWIKKINLLEEIVLEKEANLIA